LCARAHRRLRTLIWFLYEWLISTRLDLPDAIAGRYVPVLDPDL
jgi:hypothetical protein